MKACKTLPLLLASLAACSTPQTTPAAGAAPASAAPASAAPASPVIEATSRGLWYGKPPLKEHFFDVVLHNPAPAPRWLVLPSTFPYAHDTKPAPGDGPVSEIHVAVLAEHPRVVLLEAVGATFQAVQLPAHGSVTIRRLVIESWWDDVPQETDVEVLVAREITVGGEPLARRMTVPTMSESGGDVQAPRDVADPRMIAVWHPADGGSQPVSIDVESRARARTRLLREMNDGD